ncbi:hypothetical protein CWE23_06450 [Idiomarina aquatica]|uniref:Uncharacterized protein n=1 Tax=Idiomarina aquatica TaxID=1327752 RepID=A0AA94EHX8_9GAMM|nr:hypothetical protein CWE23_06450 [Idiomarina aquatica]
MRPSNKKLLFRYLLLFPIYNVVGIAVGSYVLYLLFGWEKSYAIAFFKVGAVFLVLLFYLLNIRTLITAISGTFSSKKSL